MLTGQTPAERAFVGGQLGHVDPAQPPVLEAYGNSSVSVQETGCDVGQRRHVPGNEYRTAGPALDQGVRVGIEYTPGIRPRLLVFPMRGLDSVRAILQRDLDYSDRFEMIYLREQGAAPMGSVNYDLYRPLGPQYGV